MTNVLAFNENSIQDVPVDEGPRVTEDLLAVKMAIGLIDVQAEESENG